MFTVKLRSQHDAAHLLPQPMPLPSINIIHFIVSEIQPRQAPHPHPPHPDTMGENNSCTALKVCVVKIVFDHVTLIKVKFIN